MNVTSICPVEGFSFCPFLGHFVPDLSEFLPDCIGHRMETYIFPHISSVTLFPFKVPVVTYSE